MYFYREVLPQLSRLQLCYQPKSKRTKNHLSAIYVLDCTVHDLPSKYLYGYPRSCSPRTNLVPTDPLGYEHLPVDFLEVPRLCYSLSAPCLLFRIKMCALPLVRRSYTPVSGTLIMLDLIG